MLSNSTNYLHNSITITIFVKLYPEKVGVCLMTSCGCEPLPKIVWNRRFVTGYRSTERCSMIIFLIHT